MTERRLDDLLNRALSTGELPADATPEERAALEPLLAARDAIRRENDQVRREADAAMPVARARFQRFLAEHASAATVERRTVASRPTILQRLFGPRRLAFAASLAAVLVLAAIAVVTTGPFTGVETVSALEANDYVQLPGVVASVEGDTVTLDAPDLGTVTIDTSARPAFLDQSGAPLDRAPKPGEALLVTGTVREAARGRVAIEAHTLALGSADALPGPSDRPLEKLRKLPPGVEGAVLLLAIDPENRNPRAILRLADGRSVLVPADPGSIPGLLAGTGEPLIPRVRLNDAGEGPFRLEPLEEPAHHDDDDGPGRPGMTRLAGTITAQQPGTLQLATASGSVTVDLAPRARILPGTSGLELDQIKAGASLVGYSAVLSARADRSGRLVAELVVLGEQR